MSRPDKWLTSESERWVREAIVTAEQATRIRALYQPAGTQVVRGGLSWGLVVFFGMGAVVVGDRWRWVATGWPD